MQPLLQRLIRRLEILRDVGLGYLTLSREGRTLSAGEARRVHLSSALGAGVTGTLYVLDEPSIGLHPRDTLRLVELLRALADTGNTVVIVEHDADIIRAADHVIELGPGAGRRGGQLVFAGPPKTLAKTDTAAARALAGPGPAIELAPFAGANNTLRIRGARTRTLRNLDVDIPLGKLVCITGVSGSGKSTLLHDVLGYGLPRVLTGARLDPERVDRIEGAEHVASVEVVDTSPLARSTRSIPATYLGAWAPIRDVLANSADARRLGLTARDFSFNSGGGRCAVCSGLGTVTVDMQFLADITIECEACRGRRFGPRVLDAAWFGFTVDKILGLTVDEADRLFTAHAAVRKRLAPLMRVGLGYIVLGQATSTLSGGEAQRLKLAAHLAARGGARRVFLLDEPTTGLHLDDVAHLLRAFAALIDRGATLLVVEHHLEVIRHAHHLIDLGPEGGEDGGQIVAQGSIFDLMDAPQSHTGRALLEYLGGP